MSTRPDIIPPCITFYDNTKAHQVQTDSTDIAVHFKQRDSLYRMLGLPPLLVEGKNLLEFGPGSGFNSVYTASLKPACYILVEGVPALAHSTRCMLAEQRSDSVQIEVIESLIENFDTEKRFDIVFAEKTIHLQPNPKKTLHHISKFVKPGGLLVITCTSGTGVLGEILRRLIRDRLMSPHDLPKLQIERFKQIFGQHLRTFPVPTRDVEDWILDNIVHPWQEGGVLSVPEAIDAIEVNYDIYAGSPHYFSDFRWYKMIIGHDRGFNERACRSYFTNIVNMLDYRNNLPPHDPKIGQQMAIIGEKIYSGMIKIETNHQSASFEDIVGMVNELTSLVLPFSPATAEALHEIADWLANPSRPIESMHAFAEYWSRGTQYVSFIRRMSTLVSLLEE